MMKNLVPCEGPEHTHAKHIINTLFVSYFSFFRRKINKQIRKGLLMRSVVPNEGSNVCRNRYAMNFEIGLTAKLRNAIQ